MKTTVMLWNLNRRHVLPAVNNGSRIRELPQPDTDQDLHPFEDAGTASGTENDMYDDQLDMTQQLEHQTIEEPNNLTPNVLSGIKLNEPLSEILALSTDPIKVEIVPLFEPSSSVVTEIENLLLAKVEQGNVIEVIDDMEVAFVREQRQRTIIEKDQPSREKSKLQTAHKKERKNRKIRNQ